MIMIIMATLILCVAAYIWQQATVPAPFHWFGWVALFLLAVLLFLKVTGISIA